MDVSIQGGPFYDLKLLTNEEMPWEKTLKERYLSLSFYNFWNSVYRFQ